MDALLTAIVLRKTPLNDRDNINPTWKAQIRSHEGDLPAIVKLIPEHDIAIECLHASLCKLPALMALDEDDVEPNGKDNTLSAWIKQVQNKAIASFPDWQGCFNVAETLADGDKVTLHFARESLAVNIGLITPNKLTPRANDVKIKLWNLEHLPSHYQNRRLVLGVPRDDAPEMADHKVKDRVLSKIDALFTEAKNSNIALQTAYDADAAVKLMVAA